MIPNSKQFEDLDSFVWNVIIYIYIQYYNVLYNNMQSKPSRLPIRKPPFPPLSSHESQEECWLRSKAQLREAETEANREMGQKLKTWKSTDWI